MADTKKDSKKSKKKKSLGRLVSLPNKMKRVLAQKPAASEGLEPVVDATLVRSDLQSTLTASQIDDAKITFGDSELLDGFVIIDSDTVKAPSEEDKLPKAVKKVLSFLEENGFNPHKLSELNAEGQTPITAAILQGKSISKISKLIKAGAYVNQSNQDGFSPLQLAMFTNQPEIAAMLINKHADFYAVMDVVEKDGHSVYRRIEDCLPELTSKANNKAKHWAKFGKTLAGLKKKRNHYIVPPPPIENLVFEGGGAKGTVYVGALKVLEEKGVLQGVKRIAGSSAGGITALLVALGHSADEIEKEMNDMNFTDFMDGGSFFSKMYNMLWDNRHGVHKGDTFYKWAESKIASKLDLKTATFADLHEAMKTHPEMKDLFLTGTNLTTGRTEVFSFETTPNMKLADAVRVTMSFPGAFQAVPLTNEKGETHYYADGGIKKNYPMDIFDESKYLPTGYGHNDQGVNPGTLGFKVDDAQECDDVRWNKPKADDSKGVGFFGWLGRLAGSARASDKEEVGKKYSTNTVQINDTGVDTLDFDLTTTQKQGLVESGRSETENHLNLYHAPDVYYGSEDELGTAVAPRPELDRRKSTEELRELRLDLACQREKLLAKEHKGLHFMQQRQALNYRIAQLDNFIGQSETSDLTQSIVFSALQQREALGQTCGQEAKDDDATTVTNPFRQPTLVC